MYIFKNAFLTITRNKGRNILMGIIIFVIAVSCCIALAIRSSATKLVNSYKSKYDVEATIGMNRDNMMRDFRGEPSSNGGEMPSEEDGEPEEREMPNVESLTEDEILEYGDSKYVESFYYQYQFNMDADVEALSSDSGNNMGRMKNMDNGDFQVVGYDSLESMSDFISGKYVISEGSIDDDFTSDTCIISYELATADDISVGDKITLINPNDEEKTYELEVTGIYKQEEDEDSEMGSMFSNSANMIITNKTVSKKISDDDEALRVTLSPTFVLTSKDVIEDFTKEVEDKGLSEYYSVESILDLINSETASITNVSNFALVFLIVTLIIGGVVLFVLNMINVRERKYEIGVLRTIGMKKSLVCSQFVVELLIVSIVALTLGTIGGSILSVPTANYLLENEIESAKTVQNEVQNNFGRGPESNQEKGLFEPKKMNGVMNIDQVTSINAVVDFKVVLQLFGIGILLTVVSSLSSMIMISRFSPLTILRERT